MMSSISRLHSSPLNIIHTSCIIQPSTFVQHACCIMHDAPPQKTHITTDNITTTHPLMITSHPNKSHSIEWHCIASHSNTLQYIATHHNMQHIAQYPLKSTRITSTDVTSHHITSLHNTSHHSSHQVYITYTSHTSNHITHLITHHITHHTLHHITSRRITSRRISWHRTFQHIISKTITSLYHTTLHDMI